VSYSPSYALPRSPAAAADSPGIVERAIRASGVRQAFWNWATQQSRHRPFLQLLERVTQLDGDIIECGVFQGKSLLRIATRLKQHGARKMVHGLDSFDGFPRDCVGEIDLGPGRSLQRVRGRFRGASEAPLRILRTAADLDLPIKLHVGYFDETLPRLIAAGKQFCFVHIDCDIYESYRCCLERLYDATVPGGVILFDEYRCSSWPGATQAVDEFFASKPEKPQACHDPGRPTKPKYYVRKQLPPGSGLSRAFN
jgi:predicted O-methyltransferase YrrM